jgi:transcriptional regulator with XRE-family HTH domain
VGSDAPYAENSASVNMTSNPREKVMKLTGAEEVKAGFGRTMAHLAAVFGVSRQTFYNWLNGEIPKKKHQGKLVQLAASARVFIEAGFKPTSMSLDRTVVHGKSFIELIGQGADGKEIAERLIRLEKRGASARAKLDALLGREVNKGRNYEQS